jgi:hypothetical protein
LVVLNLGAVGSDVLAEIRAERVIWKLGKGGADGLRFLGHKGTIPQVREREHPADQSMDGGGLTGCSFFHCRNSSGESYWT